MQYYVQYRDRNNNLVKKTYKGYKNVTVYQKKTKRAKTELVYKSRTFRKPVSYWESRVTEKKGIVAVPILVKEEKEFRNQFVLGKKYDPQKKVFYDKAEDLKKKYNAVVGYYSVDISGLYPTKRRRVIVRKRLYFRKGDKRSVEALGKKIEEIGKDELKAEGYQKIDYKGMSGYNWKRKSEGRDIFSQRLVKFHKAKKKGKS